jgi:phosphoenolpyruvate carboxykinase (GTP)
VQTLEFVKLATALCKPDKVHLVNGSDRENQMLLDLLEEGGTIQKLNQELRPGCYAARSDPADVARSMGDT